jgi:hypothetical protein
MTTRVFDAEFVGDDGSPRPPEGLPVPATAPSYLRADTGVLSWLLTTDHKRIGLMFYAVIVSMLMLGGVFALLLRTELITPERTIMDAPTYNRMFTLHGITMVWLFMIPSIPNAFGNFVLPIMLGAKDLAFPRLNLLSFYVYMVGAAITIGAMIWGGVDTGWTFYVPYSTATQSAVGIVVAGIFVLGVSTIMTSINFIVTTHTMRSEGLTWFRLPLFVWSIYATSIIMLLATPVLGLSMALVGIDRVYHFGIFDPMLGGDPVLFQHLFWFYSHPAVYIMILPAMGVISEVVCTFSRMRPASYTAIAMSALGIAFVGFGTWGHHMFVAGISEFDANVFGVLFRRHLLRHQSLHMGGDDVPRVGAFQYADALFFLVSLPVRVRRNDRGGRRDAIARRALARHLLRRRALPLRDGRRDDDGVSRRGALLVSEDVRKTLLRADGTSYVVCRVHRTRIDVLSSVSTRERGHAAAVLQLPGALPMAQRALDGRRVASRGRSLSHAGKPPHCASLGRAGESQPLGLAKLRMADSHGSAEAQLRRIAFHRSRSVRLRPAGG